MNHCTTILARLAGLALIAALLALGGCKIVSIENDREARERRSDSFDAQGHVARIWEPRILPALDAAALDVSTLLATPDDKLDALGHAHARKAGEGSPWTFVVRGEGTVTAIDRISRQGSLKLAIAGAAPREVALLTGPVITESTVRDALPMFDFNDFTDQVAYASVSRALTARALAQPSVVAAKVPVGARVRFLGAAHVSAGGGPLRVLPVRLEALRN